MFSKCTKLAVMLYNREELPMEMFMQNLKKDQATPHESNLLSPVVDNSVGILEYHHKINDMISFTHYAQ